MDARTLDDAETRLRELQLTEREDLGLGALALALAVAATLVTPSLALPLFLGGLGVGLLGVQALWRRWDLVDRLAGDRDAYSIPEVRAYAARETTMERRRGLASLIRSTLGSEGTVGEARVDALAELETLAAELDDPELELDPASAVSCVHLLTDPVESPLLDPRHPADELRARILRIRQGFRPRPGV